MQTATKKSRGLIPDAEELREWRASAEKRAGALAAWRRGDSRAVAAAGYREVGENSIDVPLTRDLEELRQFRAQSININTGGGYLAPEGFEANLEVSLVLLNALRQCGTARRVERGSDIPAPTVNEATVEGGIIPEDVQDTQVDITTFGQARFNFQKFTSGILAIPYEWWEDSGIAVQDVAGRILGDRVARAQNRYFTARLFEEATLGLTTSSQTAIAGDEIMGLKYSL